MGNGTIPHWGLGTDLGSPPCVCGSWVGRLVRPWRTTGRQTQVSRLFSQLCLPVGESFTPRSSFHYDKDLFFQLKSDFSNPWDSYIYPTLTVPSQWPDSDFEVPSNPAFSLYQIWERDGSYTEILPPHSIWCSWHNPWAWVWTANEALGIQTLGFCLVQTPMAMI